MADETKPAAGRSYHIGEVGAGARVAQGENISWHESIVALPQGDSLAQQFRALLERISDDSSLDEDTRLLAQDKTKAIAAGLSEIKTSPGKFRLALLDAKAFFGGALSWAGKALGDILKSDAAQKTIGTVTEATTKAAIDSFLK
jgi:hypothetical protein